LAREVAEELRVLVVAGVTAGVVVAGLGGRLAMFALRLSSPDDVRGVTSDDGFTVGRFTVGGTYGLLLIGAAVGVIGAATYRWVAPWLIGPWWARRLTTALAAAAVVGSMLVHADGVDFTLLRPTWFAVGLFVALPAVFAVVVGVGVDRVARPSSWTVRGRRRWLVPFLLLAGVPPVAVIVAISAVVLCVWAPLRREPAWARLRATRPFGVVVRAGWLAVALVGLVALLGDIAALTQS
jgi:hypothetical protein